MASKIGVGIVTCGREDMFKKCVNSIPDSIETLVVVNDATPYESSSYPAKVKLIQNATHVPVGVSKNILLRYFMDRDFDHLFLLEDDICITNPQVFEKYIKAAEVSGILHFNYGYHGANRDSNGMPHPFLIIDYGHDVKIAFTSSVVGAFSYYHRIVIEKVGYMDERFNNAVEHVEHTARIAREGFHPPFFWFADIDRSFDFIGELDPQQTRSVIRKDKEKNRLLILEADQIFKESMGYTPADMPIVPPRLLMHSLKAIHDKYAKQSQH